MLLNRLEDAKRELQQAVRLGPRDADSLAHLAYCEVKLGQVDDARRHVVAALAIKPDDELSRKIAAALGMR